MVATGSDNRAPAPAGVSARHGGHAAHAAAQSWRQLAPAAVRAIRVQADADPRRARGGLPRWHVRSEHRELTSGLYAGGDAAWVWQYDPETGRRQPVRAGTRDRIAWVSRTRYLATIVPLRLAQPDSPGVLARCHVDRDTFRRWVRCESLYAGDPDSGRRVIVRAVTVAALMEVDKRTVQRCRSAARQLGLYATVFAGRMLTQLEQIRCRLKGSPQRGLAAESAFVVPRELARITTVSCLQRGPADGHFSSAPESVVTLSTKGEREPASPARTNRSRRRENPGWRLAREVLKRLPWARQCAPGDVVGIVWRFATADPRWTAHDVITHVDQVNARNGWSSVTAADVRNPRGLLASYLRDVDPQADHPRLDVFLDADRRRAAAAAHQLAAAAGDCTCFGCLTQRQGPR